MIAPHLKYCAAAPGAISTLYTGLAVAESVLGPITGGEVVGAARFGTVHVVCRAPAAFTVAIARFLPEFHGLCGGRNRELVARGLARLGIVVLIFAPTGLNVTGASAEAVTCH